ncbi:MAG: hypothetical protein CL535_00770 [Ahrensia sp.]|nr:hypothetical protein [Ahrensia sp.]
MAPDFMLVFTYSLEMKMHFLRKAGPSGPRDIRAMSQRDLADLPPFHPLADDMVQARLSPFQPRLTALWPWSALR